jgi:hypothetical protein
MNRFGKQYLSPEGEEPKGGRMDAIKDYHGKLPTSKQAS